MTDTAIEPRELPAELIGGRLCLDFINSVHSRAETPLRDYLTDYQALLGWSALAGAASGRTLQQLARRAAHAPADARRSWRKAIGLRETLFRLFSSVIDGRAPAAQDLAEFNRWLAESAAQRRLEYRDGGFEQQWHAPGQRLDAPLWPIVDSAAELLTAGPLERVHACPGPGGCGWLFLDESKNHSRRWCSMRTCGNVAKARRHYRRQARKHTSTS